MNGIVERYRKTWQAAFAARERDLAYAIKTKTLLPGDYWHAEYKARMQLQAAIVVTEEVERCQS